MGNDHVDGPEVISEQAAAFIASLPPFSEQPLAPRFDALSDWLLYQQKVETVALKQSAIAKRHYAAELEDIDEIRVGDLDAMRILPQQRVAGPLVVFLHGGGYTVYSARSTLSASIPLALRLQSEVVAIDYLKAPQASFREVVASTGLAIDTLIVANEQSHGVVIVGDSAGGGLALAVMLWLQKTGKNLPKALVLISPWVDLLAHDETIQDPILNYEPMLKNAALAYAPRADHRHPFASPAYAEFDSCCPPVFILAGSLEMLSVSINSLHLKLQSGGVDTRLLVFSGMYHSFPTLTPDVPEARRAHNEIKKFLQQL